MFKKIYRTDFLFSSSDFITGAGSIFDLSGNYFEFNSSTSEDEADRKAIESDWGVVGQEIKKATSKKLLPSP